MFSYIEWKQALSRHEDLLQQASEHRRYSEVLRASNPLRKLTQHLQAALRKPAPAQKPDLRKGYASR